jgi:hypothetical protein
MARLNAEGQWSFVAHVLKILDMRGDDRNRVFISRDLEGSVATVGQIAPGKWQLPRGGERSALEDAAQ